MSTYCVYTYLPALYCLFIKTRSLVIEADSKEMIPRAGNTSSAGSER